MPLAGNFGRKLRECLDYSGCPPNGSSDTGVPSVLRKEEMCD